LFIVRVSRRSLSEGLRRRPSGERPRPRDGHACATGRPAADLPAAARRTDDRVGDRESQAGAALAVGRPVEAVEDPTPFLLRDPGPAVVDAEADPRPRAPTG